jgi:hypothetical protein
MVCSSGHCGPVGLGLIFGCVTGIAAFFGGLMNVNDLSAGTVSANPLLFVLATWLVLAWRVAGWWGLARGVLPLLYLCAKAISEGVEHDTNEDVDLER